MNIKDDRKLEMYLTDMAVTLTNDFNVRNQNVLKKDHERDFKSPYMKIVPKVIKNVTAFKS